MTWHVAVETVDQPEALALVAELDAHLEPLYPPESRYGLTVDGLRARGIVTEPSWRPEPEPWREPEPIRPRHRSAGCSAHPACLKQVRPGPVHRRRGLTQV